MSWIIKLTETTGKNLYVNLDQIVSFESYKWEKGDGATLRTTIMDASGSPVVFTVQETPDKVYEKMLATR